MSVETIVIDPINNRILRTKKVFLPFTVFKLWILLAFLKDIGSISEKIYRTIKDNTFRAKRKADPVINQTRFFNF